MLIGPRIRDIRLPGIVLVLTILGVVLFIASPELFLIVEALELPFSCAGEGEERDQERGQQP